MTKKLSIQENSELRAKVAKLINEGMSGEAIQKTLGIDRIKMGNLKYNAKIKGLLKSVYVKTIKRKALPNNLRDKALLRTRIYTLVMGGTSFPATAKIVGLPVKKVKNYYYYQSRITVGDRSPGFIKKMSAPISKRKSPESIIVTRVSLSVLDEFMQKVILMGIESKFGKISGIYEVVITI
jgi:hypothetical protein